MRTGDTADARATRAVEDRGSTRPNGGAVALGIFRALQAHRRATADEYLLPWLMHRVQPTRGSATGSVRAWSVRSAHLFLVVRFLLPPLDLRRGTFAPFLRAS